MLLSLFLREHKQDLLLLCTECLLAPSLSSPAGSGLPVKTLSESLSRGAQNRTQAPVLGVGGSTWNMNLGSIGESVGNVICTRTCK